MKKVFSTILFVVFLAACSGPVGVPENTTPTLPEPTLLPTDTVEIASPPDTIKAPTLEPNPTATSDTRLTPDLWQEWPVVPAVTPRAIEIYRKGQTMGLDAHAFSKVGDCQSVKAAFMGYFDIPERYSLGSDYAYLQRTIDNFSGHFNTDGQAVKGGFNAAAVLSPLWADPQVCLPGESPLDCELRVTKPIIVIVSLEVWWEGRTAAQYEVLMRRILDTIIAHGAVPILATKADNVEGDNSLNFTTAKLAYEYDLPLWNFWAAVQPLPAHGMDMNRNDGFHISTQAWNYRSFTGLEALDNIWRGLLNAVPKNPAAQVPTMTTTPENVSTPGTDMIPVSTPNENVYAPESMNGVVFGVAQRLGEEYTFPGIYMLDMDARQAKQILGEGFRFQSTSFDGKTLLVSKGSVLYRVNYDGSHPYQVTDSLYSFGKTGAIWLPDGNIAVVIMEFGGTRIALFSADGEKIGELPQSAALPVEIYPASNGKTIYWASGFCSAAGICQTSETWTSNLDSQQTERLVGITDPKISSSGKYLVSASTSSIETNTLVFTSPDGNNPKSYPLPGNILADYAWSPKSDTLAVLSSIRDDYSGKVLGERIFLIEAETWQIREYPQSKLLNPRVLWSPDGASLILMGTQPADGSYTIGGALLDLRSNQPENLDAAINLASLNYLAALNAVWLAIP